MKLLFVFLLLFIHSITATTYYISNDGNDSNSGTSPTTSGTNGPWKTLSMIETFPSFNTDDQILLRRGDTFREKFTVTTDGLVIFFKSVHYFNIIH